MTFAKTFIAALLSFIVLNVIFFLIGYGIEDELKAFFENVEEYPSYILIMLFGPIYAIPAYFLTNCVAGPQSVLVGFIIGEPEGGEVVVLIGYIAAPLVAAILSGYLGEDKKEKIGGWFLTVLLLAIITAIWVAIEIEGEGAPDEYISDFVALTIAGGFVIGIFYSFFALVVPERG